jgi:desulfoferrodoxin (superoxide reductase-like protein)
MKEYLERLQMVIQHLHHCDSKHLKTVPVHEIFNGETVWEGKVEVFAVTHPKTTRCYAWATPNGDFTAVLGVAPITTPPNAVRASMVADTHAKRVSGARLAATHG